MTRKVKQIIKSISPLSYLSQQEQNSVLMQSMVSNYLYSATSSPFADIGVFPATSSHCSASSGQAFCRSMDSALLSEDYNLELFKQQLGKPGDHFGTGSANKGLILGVRATHTGERGQMGRS